MMNMMPQQGGMQQQGSAGMSLPQMLQMIHQSQSGPGGGMPMLPAPGMASPMSNYIGAGAAPGGMMHPAMAPVQNPQPQAMGGMGGMGGAAGQTNSLMSMLAQLRGGQTGVQAGQGGVPGNTPSSLRVNPDGSITGTPGVPLPQAQAGPHGAPDFGALSAAGAFQPPPGGMPPGGAGMAPAMPPGGGQMNPALLQWLHGMMNGGGGGGAPPGAMGAGGGG